MTRVRDRAAVIATAIIQEIFRRTTVPLRDRVEEILREEISDIERQVAAERTR